ncbi:hypothetical protein QYM36_000844 [Artemia franciscana]|uniref:DNA-directed RNA polymerase III subunit RPC10 n=1 Tax=Artemia franciscana TaxID=6661 RepID=A0AA88IGV2_ARTSF|nr:hypothetical protein QYM36_000844 [Artemia franciscana]
MLYFCPKCNNKLFTEYSMEVDDIIGGSDTWKNADTTDAQCPKCGFGKAYFMQIQTRSADEPMTIILRCCECANIWRD